MAEKPGTVERLGIEHVPEDARHGSANRTFTLWFAANLTIADFVIGGLATVFFGFSVEQALPVLLAGNVVGGLLLGLAAAMGPSLGFPQMMSSRSSFGRRGNYVPGALNWISTVGWFSINTILAVFALQLVLPGANFYAAAAAYVAIQAVIAVYGHDFIHLFEKAMTVVLGALFLLIFALTVPHLGEAFSYLPASSAGVISVGGVGLLLVTSFSYLMSWAPYASDYSRYMAPSTSKGRLVLLALVGGAVSSFAVEGLGALVGSLTPSQTASSPFAGLYSFAGSYGGLAMLTLILGAFAADALNLYTNSLSALVLDVRSSRPKSVAAGAVVGFAIAAAVGARFEGFYENFLLTLAYWIMPWLAIVLVDFYLLKRTTVSSTEGVRSWDWPILGTYAASIVASVPFMNLTGYGVGYEGPASAYFGGADFSYFVSFAVAAVLAYAVRRATRGR